MAGVKSAFPLPKHVAFALAIASGLLYWLAFAGTSQVWICAFVAFVPLVFALSGQTPKRAAWIGLAAGTTMNVAGFYWLLNMLRTFSGFPTAVCMLFVLIVCAYQGGRMALMGWLYARATGRGWPAPVVFLLAFVASELLYPLLFPWYFAATVHDVPSLAQVAELGGPILVGALIVLVNLAIAEPVLALASNRKIDRRLMVSGAIGLGAQSMFGLVRIGQIDARAAAAPPVHVGVVQGNLGLFQKREDPGEGLRRHLRLTGELKEKGVELVVWSESSVTFAVPEQMKDDFMKRNVGQKLGVPAIFGAVLIRPPQAKDRERWFNTALSSDSRGNVTARYDKQYLLAFGEYLPFGDTFPILYQWSPNSGKFSAGTELDPLVMIDRDGQRHKMTTLICYEDILPGFTRQAVNASRGESELLVNMTNDAWFGDTSEPWEHLALARFRAIEHRRYLVRSTNSGVSAIVDPVGRVLAHSKTFTAERLDAKIHFMRASTIYEALGDSPWWLSSLGVAAMAFIRRKDKNKTLASPDATKSAAET